MNGFKYLVYVLCLCVLIILLITSTKERVLRPKLSARPAPSRASSRSRVDNLSPQHNSIYLLDSADIVPLRAYFDGRRMGAHNNATVIPVALLDRLVSNITGCVVDGTVQRKLFLARPTYVMWWIKRHHPVSHTEVFLWCYDMKVTSASNVSVLFNSLGSLVQVPVRRKGVVMPGRGPERDEVMVCATGYGSPDYLSQWLLYQQKIGVKFIHMNVDVSFVQNVNKSKVLQELLKSSYVKMEEWKSYLNKSQVFLHSQSFKYQDCILRYQNIYKYMMIIDFDEYFVPLGAETTVHVYAKRLLENSASVTLPSIRYYCKVTGHSQMSPPKDGNMTTMFNTTYSSIQKLGKSIHIVKLIEEASVHTAAEIVPPHKRTKMSMAYSKCYIAHLTKYSRYTKKCSIR